MAQMFNKVALPRVPRSKFNLSYVNNFACYMGQLYPALVQEVIPGDRFELSNETIIRLQPLKSPLMHKLNYDIRYFFVPNRISDDNWEKIVNGFNMSIDTSSSTFNSFIDNSSLIPKQKLVKRNLVIPGATQSQDERYQFSLWSAFGLPNNITINDTQLDTEGFSPVIYPWYAYNQVYNYYYRDQNIIDEVDLDSDVIQWSAFSKNDYFLSALPFPQKGIIPTLSFSINGAMSPVVLGDSHAITGSYTSGDFTNTSLMYKNGGSSGTRVFNYNIASVDDASSLVGNVSDKNKVNVDINTDSLEDPYASRGLWADVPNLRGVGVNADDLRELFAIQEFLEINAVGGTRFAEFIYAHFGVYTGDYRLGKPQYLGGFKNEIVVGDVPSTVPANVDGSYSVYPQGTLAGRGLGASSNRLKPFTFHEHGYIIGIFRILPVVNYAPQGFDNKFIKYSFLDYYFPSFAHLGEQAIRRGELYFSNNDAQDNFTFGYQGAYASYRHNKDISTGYMANTYDYWNLARKFGSAPALNQSFIECQGNQSYLMRPFAIQNEPPFIVSVGNGISAVRSIPTYATPARLVI